MALTISANCNLYNDYPKPFSPRNPKFELTSSQLFAQLQKHHESFMSSSIIRRRQSWVVNGSGGDSGQRDSPDDELNSLGVKAALSMLKFYKREISPMLPNSCRYVPTCSEYSMIAYKKYGVVKGTVLTAWRLCRCNPLGGSGFDPPRWFDETTPPEQ